MASFTTVLVDHYKNWSNLKPLTLTKPISYLRIGITTILEKWEALLQTKVAIKTNPSYLAHFNSNEIENSADSICYVNAAVIPTEKLVEKMASLKPGDTLYSNGELVASMTKTDFEGFENEINYTEPLIILHYPWDIFRNNDAVLRSDFEFHRTKNASKSLSTTNLVIGPKELLFLEDGARSEGVIFNTTTGPIYIGKDAEVMEGSVIRGPFALCNNATVKLATKIYGATTVGPHSKVGGEINNSVIQGYSNKGHDGFIGNSVIGEWCNLGADTNNSNLKNNYGNVKAWNFEINDFMDTELQFLGLIMGDHSKCGINTMFNTGTVVGVFANIFGADFPPKYIPSFSWGGANKTTKYDFDKAMEVAKVVMLRRGIDITEDDQRILNYIYQTE